MLLQYLIYIPTILSIIVLATFVLINNPIKKINRIFFTFASTLCIWLFFLLLSDTALSDKYALFWLNAALASSIIMAISFLVVASYFPDEKKSLGQGILYTVSVFGLILIALALSGNLVEKIERTSLGTQIISSTSIYDLHSAFIILLLVWGLVILIKKAKRFPPLSQQRSQIRITSFALGLTIIINLITNVLLVSFGASQYGLVIGIPSIVIFIAGMAYAIIKHKLFDIKLIVARSVAYLLSIGSLIFLYGLFVLVITRIFFSTQSINYTRQAIYLSAAIILGLFAPVAKNYFGKITNKLFYRDAYDPQVFLDEFNNVLVSTIDLDKLLTDSIAALESNLKADYTVFSIRETSYLPVRIIGDNDKHFEIKDIDEISEQTRHIHEKVIVTDYLNDENNELKQSLIKNDISIIIRLVATLDYDVKGIGYVLMGAKKSGNPYSKQDIQTLEIIANELVIAIQNALRFEEIEKFNATLQDKVDDATKRLQKTNEKLRQLDETKDEFISMASHQLRTPLTSVKGYLSMVLEGDAGNVSEMQHKLLDQAFTSSQRMVYLIADLLNVSRLRTGKFLIEPIATDLAEVVDGEVKQLSETAKARGIEMTFDRPAEWPKLMLDETKIRQVMMNFMDNAIYYSKTNGKIKVGLKDTGKSIEYTVTDDGIGVPKAEQHHLFTKFYRAGNAKKARPDGTGLGLFMAKKVIVAQGGAIIFRSEEGKGSTFGFSFDKSKIEQAVPAEK